ncbi:MAG: aspartate/glutamate racemase family protein [Cyanobacteria bacterium HKST-UBA04]|nr:aspartate/glutamate racemase family protein [Cyanobacteria bacterium HKST-UBA04]
MTETATLLCFDSGVGGLNTLEALLHDSPSSSLYYGADTAWVPYGDKQPSLLRARIVDLITQAVVQFPIHGVAIACNTAICALLSGGQPQTTPGEPAKLVFDDIPLPIYSVVHATVDALAQCHSAQPLGRVGVLATALTTASGVYARLIGEQLGPDVQVFEQACPDLVPLIEAGQLGDPALETALYQYMAPLLDEGMEALVLGCTHYSLLAPLAKMHGLMVGQPLTVVDSAWVFAGILKKYIHDLTVAAHESGEGEGRMMLVTGDTGLFKTTLAQLPLPHCWEIPLKHWPV